MLQVCATAERGGNKDIDRDGGTDRGKEDNDEVESSHGEGNEGGQVAENDGDSETSGLKEDSRCREWGGGWSGSRGAWEWRQSREK